MRWGEDQYILDFGLSQHEKTASDGVLRSNQLSQVEISACGSVELEGKKSGGSTCPNNTVNHPGFRAGAIEHSTSRCQAAILLELSAEVSARRRHGIQRGENWKLLTMLAQYVGVYETWGKESLPTCHVGSNPLATLHCGERGHQHPIVVSQFLKLWSSIMLKKVYFVPRACL